MKTIFKILKNKNQLLVLGLGVALILFFHHSSPMNLQSLQAPRIATQAEQLSISLTSQRTNLLSSNILTTYFSFITKKTAEGEEKGNCTELSSPQKSSFVDFFCTSN